MEKVSEIKKGIKKWVDKLKKHQLLKLQDYLTYFSKAELEHKPHRVFYVDVAESIVKDGKKNWKASLVENNKHVKSYSIGEFDSSYPAENCGISKVLEYLVEQKWEGKLLIYTDSCMSLKTFDNDHLLQLYLKKGCENIEMMKQSKHYLMLAIKLALENNINVKLEWIRGSDNPADYYSRQLTQN